MFLSIKNSGRLGQWNDQRRSTPGDQSLWRRLRDRRRPLLLRLGLVLATSLVITYLAYSLGSPLPYRVGEVHPRDLRVRVYFELINQPQTEQAREEAVDKLPHTISADPVIREEVRRSVLPVFEKFPQGTLLAPHGQPITERQLTLLSEEHRAYLRSLGPKDHARRGIALFLVMSLLAGLLALYICRFQPALAKSLPRTAAICGLAAATLALGFLLSRPPWHALVIPLTVTAMVLTIVFNPQFALVMSFSLALAATIALGTDLGHLLVLVGGLATAVLLLKNIRTRTRLVEVAGGAGLAFFLMTVATELLTGQTMSLIAFDAGRRFAWGLMAGFLLSGSLPLVERCFGLVTDVSLLELADSSHPLLQELIRRAPGTYTHSMTVATLAEAAAETIGANALLTRVGSYFHDIGKMLKPQYFIENQAGENRHDALEPALSTLIIIGHVKDGLALARQYNLPRPVMDFIQQHHGTTLVEYFYHEALRLRGVNAQSAADLEPSFRYPGPKPQNRENGIVMLADAVESTSRALSEPTPGSLRKLVHELIMKRLLDRQLEESHLTLTELHQIEESLSKNLIANFHARIKYPENKPRGLAG